MRLAAAAALALAFAAQPFAAEPLAAATPKDALVMAWNLDAIITLDPAQIAEVNGNDIMGNVCDTLVTLDYDSPSQVKPKLAESWSVAADGKTITFKLRPDLKFPSGRAATADDLAWSIRRVLKLNFGNAANLTEWGFTAANAEASFRVVDPLTLEVKLTDAYPAQLLLTGAFATNVSMMLDREAGEKNAKGEDLGNAWFKTNSACVGPYRVRTWNANDVLILERNEVYWGPKPALPRIVIRHVPESGAQRLMIEKGDADVARLLNSDDLKALEGSKDVRIEQTPMQGYIHLMFNTTDPVFANPKVRHAFRYLIDYDGLAKTVMAYQGVPRASVVPLGAFGALDAKEGQPFALDVAKARALLAEAGVPTLQRKLLLSSATPYPDLAQHIQANAAKAGVTLDLEQMAPAALFTKARAREYQVMLINWGVRAPDAHAMVSRHVMNPDNRPEAKLAQYPSWRAAWQDPAMNELGRKAMMERDPAARQALYREIQAKNMEEGPMAYMFQVVRAIAVRNEVKGFKMSAFKVGYETALK
jgi:peptide/nickel transport system substrate-binding protein